MTRKRAKELLFEINELDKCDLELKAQKIYLAKDDIPEKIFKVLQRAIDIRQANIEHEQTINPFIVLSELREGEI